MTQLLLVYLESLEIFCFEKRKIWPVLLSVFIFVNVKVVFFSILGFPYSYFQIGWYESCFCKIKGNHSSWKIKKNIVIYCDIYITWKLNYGKHFYKLSEYLFCFMYSVSTIHVEIPQIKSDYWLKCCNEIAASANKKRISSMIRLYMYHLIWWIREFYMYHSGIMGSKDYF